MFYGEMWLSMSSKELFGRGAVRMGHASSSESLRSMKPISDHDQDSDGPWQHTSSDPYSDSKRVDLHPAELGSLDFGGLNPNLHL